MTDPPRTSTVEWFYDHLAPEYDGMTSFGQRLERERPILERLVKRFRTSRALDAGAGTGLHSLLLAGMGVDVTAVDVSGAMLAEVKRHAADMALPVTLLHATFADLPGLVRSPFDTVFCLGNSIAHVSGPAELDSVLHAFAAVIRRSGTLLLQILNFKRILTSGERIQSVRETGQATYVRFHDIHTNRIDFNILTLRRSANGMKPSLETVRLTPLLEEDLHPALTGAGFRRVTSYGSLNLDPFVQERSRDLVLVCRRAT